MTTTLPYPQPVRFSTRHQRQQAVNWNMPIDPICAMEVPVTSPYHAASEGETFYFCSGSCRDRFLKNEAGADGKTETDSKQAYHVHRAPAKSPVDPSSLYTCPMHPEVEKKGPGDCPICGMALEPKSPLATLAEPESRDVKEMRLRCLVASGLAAPVLGLAMAPMVISWPTAPDAYLAWSAWLQFALTTAVLGLGWPLWQRGFSSFISLRLNMFSLILLGVAASYGMSCFLLVENTLYVPAAAHPVLFESAAVITALVLFGQFLESKARGKTASALRGLLDLVPKKVHRLEDDAESEVAVEQLVVGDLIRIRPGEAIPVDGVIIQGNPALNEAFLTGEAVPVQKAPNDFVAAGTLNQNSAFVFRATQVGAETRLAQIVALIATAQRSRAPIQSLADKVSAWFVPAVIALAVLTFSFWYFYEGNLPAALSYAVGVLIVACPCALGLATPMSLSVGLGRGAHLGILVHQASALENLARARIIALDKTGTVTEGRPVLRSIEPGPGMTEVELLTLAAALEQESEHPLARAVLDAARIRHLRLPQPQNANAITGGGMEGRILGADIVLGKRELLVGRDIKNLPSEHADASAATEILASRNGRYAGRLLLADTVKKDAAKALKELRDLGIKLVLITGDRLSVAQAISQEITFDAVHGNVSPEEKGFIIQRLRRNKEVVAMVGDGINDAPALALADVGIAMGLGADIAKQTAGLTLMHSDIKTLVRAVHLSRAVLANIRENLAFAFLYNAVSLPLATGLIADRFMPESWRHMGLSLTPMLAALAMSLSSVCVIGNALRLRWIKL